MPRVRFERGVAFVVFDRAHDAVRVERRVRYIDIGATTAARAARAFRHLRACTRIVVQRGKHVHETRALRVDGTRLRLQIVRDQRLIVENAVTIPNVACASRPS